MRQLGPKHPKPSGDVMTEVTEKTLDRYEPMDWEKYLSATVHIVSIFTPLWGPLIGWVWQRKKSPFVASHCWQALMETIVLNACLLGAALISLSFSAYRLWGYWQNNWEGFNIWEFLIRFAIGWIIVAILGVVTTVFSVLQAWRAYKGQWPGKKINPPLPQERGL